MHRPAARVESFTPEEREALAPYFGNTDSPVFALTNLPEVVKGAIFARYSRSAKSARRLFLDEFRDGATDSAPKLAGPGEARADRLYGRVFKDYGDDSVAQLGGAHIACEGVSNVLTKVLERGRLMSYLEQSTRYVPYSDRPFGRWKYFIPDEIKDRADRSRYVETLDRAFETYTRWLEPMQQHYRRLNPMRKPKKSGAVAADSDQEYAASIRAQALDTLRGLLPAATQSNVGIYGSGQAYEALLLRMRAHPLEESRRVADLMLHELRKVIPAFVQRVDRENRGVRWSEYLRTRNQASRELDINIGIVDETENDEVTLVDHDREGEVKVVAAALYAVSNLSYDRLLAAARNMTVEERTQVLRTCVGDRRNRRHRPGRAFEHATYTFDILSDYGAFRDLQRHRMLTVDWQELTTRHAPTRPAAIDDAGALSDWSRVMDESEDLHEQLARRYSSTVAQYAVSMAYRIRFHMRMNAREAMHVIELRTAPQGHSAYRRICRKMHHLIATHAKHEAIAAAMKFVDYSELGAERLEAARRRCQPTLVGIPWDTGRRLEPPISPPEATPKRSSKAAGESHQAGEPNILPLDGFEVDVATVFDEAGEERSKPRRRPPPAGPGTVRTPGGT